MLNMKLIETGKFLIQSIVESGHGSLLKVILDQKIANKQFRMLVNREYGSLNHQTISELDASLVSARATHPSPVLTEK